MLKVSKYIKLGVTVFLNMPILFSAKILAKRMDRTELSKQRAAIQYSKGEKAVGVAEKDHAISGFAVVQWREREIMWARGMPEGQT